MAKTYRVLIKLRPSVGLTAAVRGNLRPLYETVTAAGSPGLTAEPAWYLAELPDGGPTAWDSAHARVADQLGVANH